MSLTHKQQAFAAAYVIDRNGKKAAIAAGYSERGAEVAGSRLIRHPKVAAEITRLRDPTPPVVEARNEEAGLMPLDYMLRVVRDPKADPALRAKMALAAAPYMHPRASEEGKKEERAKAAKAVGGKYAPAAPPKLVVNNR